MRVSEARGGEARASGVGPRRALGAFLAASMTQLLAAGCARMEPAPGGPPDTAPPQLLAVRPDSFGVYRGFGGAVEFQFDEVIAEGGPGQGGADALARLVIVSPTTRVPKVSWHRNRIEVQPAEGWQPNRVYRIELLPGITDLRRNKSDTTVVVTFTTGAPAPTTTLTGTVIDWTTRRGVPNALVVATLLPDSLPYRALTDSSGAFTFGPLPRGKYIVTGVIDQNRDNHADSREPFDTVHLAEKDSAAGELWAFVHDSAPPRIASVNVDDSLSATVTFSQALDPRRVLTATAARLRHLPDSATVAIASLLPPAADDSLNRKPAPADTLRPPVPTPAPPTPPPAPTPQRPPVHEPPTFTSRPALYDRMVLRVSTPWEPDAHYLLEISDVRNVTGRTGNVQSVIVIPERKPPADSLKKQLPSRLPTPVRAPPKKP